MLVPLAAQNWAASQKKTQTIAKPVGIDELKTHVKKESEGIFSVGDVQHLLAIRPVVDFKCTSDVRDNFLKLEDFRKVKDSDAILRAIGCPYPDPTPPPKPPPPLKPAGPITIACTPEDCDVVVLSRASVTGDKGVKTIAELPPGETTFEVRRPGFVSARQTVSLKEGEPKSLSSRLKPLESSQRQWATEALMKAIGTTGGFMESAGLLPLLARGSVSLSDDKGQISKFGMTARLWSSQAASNSAFFLVGKGCNAGTPLLPMGKKARACGADLKDALKMWADYQFPFVVERALSNPGGLSAETDRADSNGFVATVETTSETTKIHLSETYAPISISVHGHAEGDLPLDVEYGDFVNVRSAKCPKTVSITKGAKKVRFEFTELSPVAPDSPLK